MYKCMYKMAFYKDLFKTINSLQTLDYYYSDFPLLNIKLSQTVLQLSNDYILAAVTL